MNGDAFWEKNLAILQEISNAIVSSDNVNTVAHLMLDLAINYTAAEKGSLMVLNGQGELCILSARGLDYKLARTYREKLGEGVAGIVAQEGEPVLVRDIEDDRRFRHARRDHYRTRSFISCPVKGKSGLLGVLNINDKKDGEPFTEEEFALIQLIASQAAVALKNAMLINQLKAKAAELEDVNRKLIDAGVEKTEFLTRVSHELRTPLNSIKGATYLLSHGGEEVSETQQELHGIIGSETEKLISIVEKQLDFLRAADQERIKKNSLLKVDEILRETFQSSLLQKSLAEKQLQLEIDFGSRIPEIVGDKVLVSQMFINLFDGVVFYLAPGSRLTVNTRENSCVEVSLEASAPLPEALCKDFFSNRNFYYLDGQEGSIRLHLALKAAEAHGWQMSARNGEKGFRLLLSIPKHIFKKSDVAFNSMFDMVLEFVAEVLGVDTCSFMLFDAPSGDLSIQSSRGLDARIVERSRSNVTSRIAGWVAREGKALLVENIEADPRFGQKNIAGQYNSKSFLSLPLKMDGRLVGVLNLSNKKDGSSFGQRDLRLAATLCERITNFMRFLYSDLRSDEELSQMIGALEHLVAAERKYFKKKHHITELVGQVMEILAAAEKETDLALYVSAIYDLGLVLIDHEILDKQVALSVPEANAIHMHPYSTLDLLGEIESSAEARKVILHHHERYDGSGYPSGLKGEEIPLISRVLAVVDGYCAMIEPRPYRGAHSREDAFRHILNGAGTLYDPAVVTAFSQALQA